LRLNHLNVSKRILNEEITCFAHKMSLDLLCLSAFSGPTWRWQILIATNAADLQVATQERAVAVAVAATGVYAPGQHPSIQQQIVIIH
jgi:hypothetical protein